MKWKVNNLIVLQKNEVILLTKSPISEIVIHDNNNNNKTSRLFLITSSKNWRSQDTENEFL